MTGLTIISVLITILSIAVAYLVYIKYKSRSEGFLSGDLAGEYYVPIIDTTFSTLSRYTYDDLSGAEVMYFNLNGTIMSGASAESFVTAIKTAYDMPSWGRHATLTELRKEAGYGTNTCAAGFVKNDSANNALISVYPLTSQLGMSWCGGKVYAKALAAGVCKSGCIIANNKTIRSSTGDGVIGSDGIFIYGKRPTEPASAGGLNVTKSVTVDGNRYTVVLYPFNGMTGRWSRYTTDRNGLETFVVYPAEASAADLKPDNEEFMLNICRAYDPLASTASIQQLREDHAAGANWKTSGWLSLDGPRKAAYPITDDAGDQATGIQPTKCRTGTGMTVDCERNIYEVASASDPGTSTLTARGVICYGKKPKYDEAVKTVNGVKYVAEFFNTFRRVWSKKDLTVGADAGSAITTPYKCVSSDLVMYNNDPEKNYMKRAAKYVKTMQTAGDVAITLAADKNGAYPGCGAGIYGDEEDGCWACKSPTPVPPPTVPKSDSGNWKSIGETIDPAASLADTALDVTTVNGRAKMKTGVRNVLACQAAGGVPTMGANTSYPGCGSGWCCAPDSRFTLDVATLGGAEAAGECEPADEPCIPSELFPTRPSLGSDGGLQRKKQCRPKLADSVKASIKTGGGAGAGAATAPNMESVRLTLMRDIAQQLKGDKLFARCQEGRE